ncbi:5'/3'-nucleotidase SurE [Desulforegula conservatrix]|uniref:5'/3'-nucleotidase SurE n=1 Tax=Desulforegula conservatrix TaxID=153026 RepID=UPI00040C6F65|nr:5'/3'-nucleotidase SurE [Desulforegula conservatrix]
MKIVLTNDDGIDAPGLEALKKALDDVGEVIIVAPENGQSGISHRVTMREPITVKELDKNRFMVAGTPADCTRLALKIIAPDADMVFSGINFGANLGTDVYVSGTVAAAREAAFMGKRAVALSQYIGEGKKPMWDVTSRSASKLLDFILGIDLSHGTFLNINLPFQEDHETPEPRFCDPDTTPYKLDFMEKDGTFILCDVIHYRPRKPGFDIDMCFSGYASVSKIRI